MKGYLILAGWVIVQIIEGVVSSIRDLSGLRKKEKVVDLIEQWREGR